MEWKSDLEIWAVGLSVAALSVSVLTWLDFRDQLNLYRGQVKAFVQVVEAELVEPVTESSFIKIRLRIRNCGQTAASEVEAEMDYAAGMPDHEGKGNSATRRKLGPIGPGLERIVTLQSNRQNRYEWPTPSLRNYTTVYFFGTIWYKDDTTGEERHEDWCYELPIRTADDLERTDLESFGVLTYVSKGGR